MHQRDKDGWTALHNASSRGYIDIAQVLLEKGEADINARSKMGHTPLSKHKPYFYFMLSLSVLSTCSILFGPFKTGCHWIALVALNDFNFTSIVRWK